MPLMSVLLPDMLEVAMPAAGGGAIGEVEVLLIVPPAIGSHDVSMPDIDDDDMADIEDDIDMLDEVAQPMDDDDPAMLEAAAAAFLCLLDWAASENRGAEAMPHTMAAAAQMRRSFIWLSLLKWGRREDRGVTMRQAKAKNVVTGRQLTLESISNAR